MERRSVPRWLEASAAVGWRLLVVAASLALLTYILVKLRLIVVPVIVALLLSTLLVPPARWLERRGWPALLSTFAVLLGAVALAVGLMSFIGLRVAAEADDLGDAVRQGFGQVQQWATDGPLQLSDEQLAGYADQALTQLRENTDVLAGGLLAGAALAAELVAGALIAVVVLFFFIKDGERLAAWARDRFPSGQRDRVVAGGRRAWDTLRRYLGGQAVTGLVDGAVIGIGLVIIGIPLALPLATLTFFGAFFPLVGATLAGLVAVLVALASGGLVDALLVLALVVVVQQVEGDVLAPLVLGRAVRLHPVVILLGLTAGGVIGGVLGAFLAIPLIGVAVAVHDELAAAETSGSSP